MGFLMHSSFCPLFFFSFFLLRLISWLGFFFVLVADFGSSKEYLFALGAFGSSFFFFFVCIVHSYIR